MRFCQKLAASASFVAFLFGATFCAFAAAPFENMLVINEDDSHFFGSRRPEQMTLEGLNAFVDQYANTAVTHLFLCPNSSRANFTNPARDAIWEPNCEGKESTELWPQNCKLLEERGLDPYKIWIARCREKGISPWISMRMNDLHAADDPTNFMRSSFWVQHPNFWRVPNTPSKNWFERALNFKYPEVRKHATDFIDVLFERYDFDGIELDWMRFGWHLTPGKETEEGKYLTEVVAYAKNLADKYSQTRGRKIYVAVRVPAHPDAAVGLGMDAVSWAKAGLVDLIVPCPFWSTTDFDIPVELWNERLEGTGVAVAPGAEFNVRSNPSANAKACTLEQLYGFAAMEKARGTTNVYLFNWMDCETLPVAQEKYRQMLKDGFSDEFLATVDREVPTTYRDTVPEGFPNGAQTPRETSEKPTAFYIPVGSKPTAKDGSGVVVGFADRDELDDATFDATLNGIVAENVVDVDASAIPDAKRALFFAFPQNAFEGGKVEFLLTQKSGVAQSVVFVAAKLKGAK